MNIGFLTSENKKKKTGILFNLPFLPTSLATVLSHYLNVFAFCLSHLSLHVKNALRPNFLMAF